MFGAIAGNAAGIELLRRQPGPAIVAEVGLFVCQMYRVRRAMRCVAGIPQRWWQWRVHRGLVYLLNRIVERASCSFIGFLRIGRPDDGWNLGRWADPSRMPGDLPCSVTIISL